MASLMLTEDLTEQCLASAGKSCFVMVFENPNLQIAVMPIRVRMLFSEILMDLLKCFLPGILPPYLDNKCNVRVLD